MFDVVVVGADGSATAARAVEAAARIAQMSGGTLHIVSAIGHRSHIEAGLPEEFKDIDTASDADALLQDLSFIAKRHQVEPVLHGVTGKPDDVILELANKVGADLVVVGNRGMKGVRRVLGSVPNSVAHGAQCSVAIIYTVEP